MPVTEAARIVNQNGHLIVSGDLNFLTVPLLWEQSLPLLSAYLELNFDLEKVTSSNSAGIALLIEWIKYAENSHKKINFYHISPQLSSIMNALGVSLDIVDGSLKNR